MLSCMLNDELRTSNTEPVTYSILNKEPRISNQFHIAGITLQTSISSYRTESSMVFK